MDYPRTEPRSSSSQQSRSHFYKQLTNTAFYGEKGQSQECEANRQIKWICFYCFETDIQINVPLAHKEKPGKNNAIPMAMDYIWPKEISPAPQQLSTSRYRIKSMILFASLRCGGEETSNFKFNFG